MRETTSPHGIKRINSLTNLHLENLEIDHINGSNPSSAASSMPSSVTSSTSSSQTSSKRSSVVSNSFGNSSNNSNESSPQTTAQPAFNYIAPLNNFWTNPGLWAVNSSPENLKTETAPGAESPEQPAAPTHHVYTKEERDRAAYFEEQNRANNVVSNTSSSSSAAAPTVSAGNHPFLAGSYPALLYQQAQATQLLQMQQLASLNQAAAAYVFNPPIYDTFTPKTYIYIYKLLTNLS